MLCFINNLLVVYIFSFKDIFLMCKIFIFFLILNNINFCENDLLLLSLNIWNFVNNEYMYFECFFVKCNFFFIFLLVIKIVY